MTFELTSQGPAALRIMAMIRVFESRMPILASEGLIRGSTHPSVGMEAVATGVAMCLGPQDAVASNHRGHAHCLARGADPKRTMAEIMGRTDGYCHGRGGSMHLGMAEVGMLGTNGVVGAGIGLATGSALAAKVNQTDAVSVAFFGDGAANQGVLAEALNLAAIWQLPVIFLCENNHYAMSSAMEQMTAATDLAQRGKAYGVPSVSVNGMAVSEVFDAVSPAVQRARAGEGPTFVVADTYRYLGHMAGDTEIYRDQSEVESWHERDPIAELSKRLVAEGILTEAEVTEIQAQAAAIVEEAESFARNSPFPQASTVSDDVYGEVA